MNRSGVFDRFSFLRDEPVTASYDTRIAGSRHPPFTWRSGLVLVIGYTWPSEAAAPVPIITLGAQDCSQNAALTMDSGDRLIVAIDLGAIADIVCPAVPAMYLKAQATIEADGRTFDGVVASTCSDRSGPAPYPWTGSVAVAAGAFTHLIESVDLIYSGCCSNEWGHF